MLRTGIQDIGGEKGKGKGKSKAESMFSAGDWEVNRSLKRT